MFAQELEQRAHRAQRGGGRHCETARGNFGGNGFGHYLDCRDTFKVYTFVKIKQIVILLDFAFKLC